MKKSKRVNKMLFTKEEQMNRRAWNTFKGVTSYINSLLLEDKPQRTFLLKFKYYSSKLFFDLALIELEKEMSENLINFLLKEKK